MQRFRYGCEWFLYDVLMKHLTHKMFFFVGNVVEKSILHSSVQARLESIIK